jgi:hypothetical protein
MTEVSRIIAKMLYEQKQGASIGSGAIALNDALCENLFASVYVFVLNGNNHYFFLAEFYHMLFIDLFLLLF